MNKRSLLVILSLVFSFSFSYNQKQISSYVDVMLSQILYDSISLKDLSIEEEKIKYNNRIVFETELINLCNLPIIQNNSIINNFEKHMRITTELYDF